jgi:hypothetical protein
VLTDVTCSFFPSDHVHHVDLIGHVDVARHDRVRALLEVDVVIVVVVIVAVENEKFN